MPKEEKRRLLGASPPPARGLRPPRIAKAILPPGIPMMSRLRRHAFVCLGYAAPIAPLPPAHRQDPPLQMAFQKSQADRWRSDREDREGGNVPTGAISGPHSAILAPGQTPGFGTAYCHLRTYNDGPIFRRQNPSDWKSAGKGRS